MEIELTPQESSILKEYNRIKLEAEKNVEAARIQISVAITTICQLHGVQPGLQILVDSEFKKATIEEGKP